MIAENIQQIRELQTINVGTENEQKLFNQVKIFHKEIFLDIKKLEKCFALKHFASVT